MMQKTKAKTPKEYIGALEEPRKTEIQKIHDFIVKTVPELEPYIQSEFLGYGKFHYKYASGRERDWCKIAVASQKNYISIYACAVEDGKYIAQKYKEELKPASVGKSCIRYKKFKDINFEVLEKVLKETSEKPFNI